jgi:molybdopterin synthase catalytic subunit
MKSHIRVEYENFDVGLEYQRLRLLCHQIGAVVTFTGLVRDFEDSGNQKVGNDSLSAMDLQHYPEMTEDLITNIVEEAAVRWSLLGVTIVHRVGKLLPNDQIVFVGVASRHRSEAFNAAEFLMDYLKLKATFWKRVQVGDQWRWISPKSRDADAMLKWGRR